MALSAPISVEAYWATAAWTTTWSLTSWGWIYVTVTWYDFSTTTWAVASWSLLLRDSTWSSTGWTLAVTSSWSTSLIFSHANTLSANENYFVSFRTVWTDLTADTADDALFTAMYYGWSWNTVTVTAIVEPTLTLSLTGTTVAFGVLDSSAVTTASTTTTGTITTNATSGYSVSVAATWTWGSAGLYSTSSNTLISWSGSTAAGEAWFNIEVWTWAVTWKLGNSVMTINNFASTDTTTVISTWATTMMSWNASTSWDIFTVAYKAWISAVTPAASDYTTTVTFTISWNF